MERGSRNDPESAGFGVARLAALAAVIGATVLVGLLIFGGGGGYRVKARFLNAGQLVTGNLVETGGVAIGKVKGIRVTDDGQAEVTLEIDDAHAPLRRGTRATISQVSQSGIANRYVDLTPGPQSGAPIPDGGLLGTDRTTTAVDVDQLFNTLDPRTRRALQGFFKGSARMFRGRATQANEGLQYLNPALATSSRLFGELTHDTPLLERFLVDSSRLVTTLAERRDDLAALVGNLNTTTRALGNQRSALAESIGRLPPFMRRANTTFVNLRSALDDVDPLVAASKPVARRLGPFLEQTRAFAADARPTIADLRGALRRRGRSNDLVELVRSLPALEDIAMDTRRRTAAPGDRRVDLGAARGAFPELAAAARGSAPSLAMARPYTNDFLGWLDDFSTTGPYDALGGVARPWISLSEILNGPLKTRQFRRCPGAADFAAPDRSNVFTPAEQAELDCKESDRAPGP
jgi:phospholipid/cholesterol/gamma-HCH transport system substrate-binding protein